MQDKRLGELRTEHDLEDGDQCGYCREVPLGSNDDCHRCIAYSNTSFLLDVIDKQAARIRKLETMLESDRPKKEKSACVCGRLVPERYVRPKHLCACRREWRWVGGLKRYVLQSPVGEHV